MRITLALFLALALLPASASALTVQDMMALSKAGFSDEVLLALIDRDKPVFSIDPDALIALKREGVSEKIVLAMLKSGRQEPPSPRTQVTITPRVPDEPRVVMFGHGPERPNTYHEYDRLGLSELSAPYVVPYIAPYIVPSVVVVAPRAAVPCQSGRRPTTGSSTDRPTGLADASQKFVNNGLLPVLAAGAGETDCQQTPPAPPIRRPRK